MNELLAAAALDAVAVHPWSPANTIVVNTFVNLLFVNCRAFLLLQLK
jgi:hypothetical protein